MRQAKVGVIGVGIGKGHLRNYREAETAQVVAICDKDEARLEAVVEDWPAAEPFTDYHQMLEMPELEGVSVALPNYLHAPVTIDALKAGKHVLCEKPMAMNVAQAVKMKETAEQEDRILMMRFNMRRFPIYQSVKRLADAGRLGDIYHMVTTYTRRDTYPGLGGWFGQKDKSGGGPLIDLGVHRLDLSLWIAGYPRPVGVVGRTYDWMAQRKLADSDVEFDCEDFAVGMVLLEGGCALYLTASWDGHQPRGAEQLMRIYGTEAGIFEEAPPGGEKQVVMCSRENGVPLNSVVEPTKAKETCQGEFARCILEGARPTATAEQGIIVQKILDALYESSRTGETMKIQCKTSAN